MDNGPWIETYTGKTFHLLNPTVEEVDIYDIAHALSNQCRFTGHVRVFYSVAEHCWHASYMVPREHALKALLHDSPEAYISDISRPLKHHTALGSPYLEIEEKIFEAICQRFRMDNSMPVEVKAADNRLLWMEKKELMTATAWGENDCDKQCQPDFDKVDFNERKILADYPAIAKFRFLDRFAELTGLTSYDKRSRSGLVTIAEKLPLPTKG